MPSKMSWFNKELILQIGRSTGWISIVYFLGLLISLPLRMMMMFSGDYRLDNDMIRTLFYFDFHIQVSLMIVVPVLLAVFLFRFLHVKQATDLIHSLPMTREKVFHHYALTGMVFLAVPVTIITIAIFIVRSNLALQHVFSVEDVFYWAGVTLLINFLLYTAGVFIAMLTGISAVQAVLTYIMLLFPAGITLLFFYNLKVFVYGFPVDFYLERDWVKLSPLTYSSVLDESSPMQWKTALIYFIFIILLYILALFFYKKRNLEVASEAIAFPKLRLLFKYGLTFGMMMLGGMYFHELSGSGFGWTLFGYVFGTILGYYLAEIILRKSWRVFSHVKGLVVYSAIVVLLSFGFQTLGFYENKLPKEKEIKNVVVTDSPYLYLSDDGKNGDLYAPIPLKEKENIEEVLKLHKQIIADKELNEGQESLNRNGNFFFVYELANGKKMIRDYNVNMARYQDLYKPIFESAEYKMASKEIFKVNEKKVKTLQVVAYGPVNKVVTLSDSKEIKEAISILKEDVLAESYEDSLYYQYRGSSIELNTGNLHNNYISLEFKPSYMKFAKWLKEKDMLDKAQVNGEDISHVIVSKGDFTDIDPEQVKMSIEQDEDALKITDKEQINLSWEKAGGDSRHEYAAVFYYQDGRHYEVFSFDEEHVPNFVSEHFQ